MSLARSVTAAFLLVSVSSILFAQPQAPGRGGGFGRMRLVEDPNYGFIMLMAKNKQIQEELALSDEQLKGIDELWEEVRDAFTPGEFRKAPRQDADKKAEEALPKILTPAQLTRLRQVTLQRQGPMVLKRANVAEQLGLTDDQLKKFLEIQGAHRPPIGRPTTAEERRQQNENMREWKKTMMVEMLAVLTDEQRAKWDEMIGEEFKFLDPPYAAEPSATPSANRPSEKKIRLDCPKLPGNETARAPVP